MLLAISRSPITSGWVALLYIALKPCSRSALTRAREFSTTTSGEYAYLSWFAA